MDQAVGLARCKMGEIEEGLGGLSADRAREPCCEEETQLRCKWSMSVAHLSAGGLGRRGCGTESPHTSIDALGEASDSLASGDTAVRPELPHASMGAGAWPQWRWGSSTLSQKHLRGEHSQGDRAGGLVGGAARAVT